MRVHVRIYVRMRIYVGSDVRDSSILFLIIVTSSSMLSKLKITARQKVGGRLKSHDSMEWSFVTRQPCTKLTNIQVDMGILN